MKVKVSKDLCIGCGACQSLVPDVFEIEDDGLATVKVDEVEKDLEEDTQDAIENCPTQAISEIDE
ncbi:MAG: ferredoxin [Clostridium sp.]|nr:ferredoxin [Clostridium sp.]MCM1444231.1 ferredoxin [Candidatus Amulumruptor caecigallinarius]